MCTLFLILDENVTNFHELTIGKFMKQTVKTNKVKSRRNQSRSSNNVHKLDTMCR